MFTVVVKKEKVLYTLGKEETSKKGESYVWSCSEDIIKKVKKKKENSRKEDNRGYAKK